MCAVLASAPLSAISRADSLCCVLCSAVPALAGRTALQCYTDLMVSFREQFKDLLGGVITDANVGLGPKGELRYPSNPLDDRWNFPGIGEFQVGDRYEQSLPGCLAMCVLFERSTL